MKSCRGCFFGFVAASATFLSSHNAMANSYDKCILEHMGSAQNKSAVYSIQRACISEVSKDLPKKALEEIHGGASAGKFNTGDGEEKPALYVKVENFTGYDITSISIDIVNDYTKKVRHYEINDFISPLQRGAIISGPGTPELSGIIMAGSRRDFVFPIPAFINSTNFGRKFYWNITAAKGFRNSDPS